MEQKYENLNLSMRDEKSLDMFEEIAKKRNGKFEEAIRVIINNTLNIPGEDAASMNNVREFIALRYGILPWNRITSKEEINSEIVDMSKSPLINQYLNGYATIYRRKNFLRFEQIICKKGEDKTEGRKRYSATPLGKFIESLYK